MDVSEPKDEEIAYSSMRASIKVLFVCLFFNFKPDKMTCLQNGYRRGWWLKKGGSRVSQLQALLIHANVCFLIIKTVKN